MEELTKRNGKRMWPREIENDLERLGASLELLIELTSHFPDVEIDLVKWNGEMEDGEKRIMLRVKRSKNNRISLKKEVLSDTHFNIGFFEESPRRFCRRSLPTRGRSM